MKEDNQITRLIGQIAHCIDKTIKKPILRTRFYEKPKLRGMF